MSHKPSSAGLILAKDTKTSQHLERSQMNTLFLNLHSTEENKTHKKKLSDAVLKAEEANEILTVWEISAKRHIEICVFTELISLYVNLR